MVCLAVTLFRMMRSLNERASLSDVSLAIEFPLKFVQLLPFLLSCQSTVCCQYFHQHEQLHRSRYLLPFRCTVALACTLVIIPSAAAAAAVNCVVESSQDQFLSGEVE
jgi:hypothetical protein